MTEQHTITPVSVPLTAGQMAKKPAHLIILTDGKKRELFIAVEKPDFLGGAVFAHGFMVDPKSDEDAIRQGFMEIISTEPKENIEEVYFPMHRVVSVKSLVYRAK